MRKEIPNEKGEKVRLLVLLFLFFGVGFLGYVFFNVGVGVVTVERK